MIRLTFLILKKVDSLFNKLFMKNNLYLFLKTVDKIKKIIK